MKKFILMSGMLLLFSTSHFCLAEESHREVRADRFGGNLYYYLDRDGNRCMTNGVDSLPETSLRQQKEERADHRSRVPSTILILADNSKTGDGVGGYLEEYGNNEDMEIPGEIPDPLEPMNRVFFQFNDKLYFYLLKPVASGYKAVLPTTIRTSVGNFFDNIIYPIRFVSCLFQGKIEGAFVETGRFLTNSTIGLAGLFDPATDLLNLKKYDEDAGQTLGTWGLGFGFYLDLPFLGPSSLRDGIGKVGDYFLDPIYYFCPDFWDKAAFKSTDVINSTSFHIGDYESLKESSIDPYIALRNAYFQYRTRAVEE